jgi:KUP system potassium uptake protein
MHEKVLLVAVETLEVPRVSEAERFRVTPISDGISRIELRFGFMERPDVPKGLETALRYDQIANCDLRTATTLATKQSFLLGAGRGWRAGGRRCLGSCTAMRSALALFNIPHDKIMEIGIEFEI